MADVAPTLDANSFVAITPVTLDGSGNPVSYGMPMYVKLGDVAAWIGSGGSFIVPPATASVVGGVKQAVAVPALTNNSGGTSGGNTIAAVTDVATANNAIATLAVKVNAILAALVAAGTLHA